MARPKGARNAVPSQAERRDLIQLLRSRAEQGDPQAAGWLLLLAEIRPPRENKQGQA